MEASTLVSMVEIAESNSLSPTAPQPTTTSALQEKLLERFRSIYCKVAAGLLLSVAAGDARSEDMVEPPNQNPERRFFVAGGGHLPENVHRKFVEMAGGRNGRVLVVPTASQAAKDDKNIDSYWKWQHEVQSATLMHADDTETADRDEFVSELNDATALWFNGGDQGDLVDRYRNTRFHKELLKFSERGGLIGGTSAGASAMSSIMIRKGDFTAELDQGFGLVPWAVIDQHHLRKGRLERLLGVSKKHPDQLCIGIKDRTAVILNWTVKNVTATVVGEGDVRFFRDQKEQKILHDGETFDFSTGETFFGQRKAGSLDTTVGAP